MSEVAAAGMSEGRKTFVVALLTMLAVLVPLWPAMEAPLGLRMDEGTLLVYPELILKGLLPYRDFETFYGPANLYALAGAYSIFGVALPVARGLALVYQLSTLLGIFLLARRWGFGPACGATLIAAVILRPMHLVAFAWMGAVACAIWCLVVLAKAEGRWRMPVAGVLAGATMLFRQDLALGIVAAALPLWLARPAQERRIFLTAAALTLLPYLWLTFAAGPAEMFNNLFLFPVIRCNPGRHLPLSGAPHPEQVLFALHFAACLCNLTAGAFAIRRSPRSLEARVLLAAALLALGLTHQTLQRVDIVHIACTAFLSLSLLPASLCVLLARGQVEAPVPRRGILVTAFVLTLLCVGVASISIFYFRRVLDVFEGKANITATIVSREREIPCRTLGEARDSNRLMTRMELASKPGERVFVGPRDLRRTNYTDTYLYHLLPWLTPATYFLEFNPFSANRPNSRLAADVATADWLILNPYWDGWKEPNASLEFGSDAPNEVVRTQFEFLGRVGQYEVFHRKSLVPVPEA